MYKINNMYYNQFFNEKDNKYTFIVYGNEPTIFISSDINGYISFDLSYTHSISYLTINNGVEIFKLINNKSYKIKIYKKYKIKITQSLSKINDKVILTNFIFLQNHYDETGYIDPIDKYINNTIITSNEISNKIDDIQKLI